MPDFIVLLDHQKALFNMIWLWEALIISLTVSPFNWSLLDRASAWFPSCIILTISLVRWDLCQNPLFVRLHYFEHLIRLSEYQPISLHLFVEHYLVSQNLYLVPQMYCLEQLTSLNIKGLSGSLTALSGTFVYQIKNSA